MSPLHLICTFVWALSQFSTLYIQFSSVQFLSSWKEAAELLFMLFICPGVRHIKHKPNFHLCNPPPPPPILFVFLCRHRFYFCFSIPAVLSLYRDQIRVKYQTSMLSLVYGFLTMSKVTSSISTVKLCVFVLAWTKIQEGGLWLLKKCWFKFFYPVQTGMEDISYSTWHQYFHMAPVQTCVLARSFSFCDNLYLWVLLQTGYFLSLKKPLGEHGPQVSNFPSAAECL